MENTQSKKFYQKKWFWIVAGVVLVFWIASSGSPKNTSTSQGGNTATKTEENKPVEAVKVTASNLMKDYEANEVSADQKYKGKILEITGTIDSIGKDILDTPYVSLVTSNMFGTVQCMFEKTQEGELAELGKGKSITLRGEGNGKLGNVLVKECQIVK